MTTYDVLKNTYPLLNIPVSKFSKCDIPENHTSDTLYYNNLKNEKELYELLKTIKIKKYILDFKETPRYFEFDYICEVPILKPAYIFIELKSRKVNIKAFKKTIFPVSKINYYRKLKKINKSVNTALILIFSFLNDDKKNEYYYIQYNKNTFERYKLLYNTLSLKNGEYYNIPTEDLKKLDDLDLNNYINTLENL
jgi:hypothetical protein